LVTKKPNPQIPLKQSNKGKNNMAKTTRGPARTMAERRIQALQGDGSYDLRKNMNSRRWAMYAVIVPRAGQTQIDVVVDNTSRPYAKHLSNVKTAQLPTGRSFVAERISFKALPYNADANTWTTQPSVKQLQEMGLLLKGSYHNWGRLGAPDGWDAEFVGSEIFPTISDIVEITDVPGNNALSVASHGGETSGHYKLLVPVNFGQNVQFKHTIDLGFDPAVKFPELFPSTPQAGTAANFVWVVFYAGGITRLGV
jgi:hypothetical protein